MTILAKKVTNGSKSGHFTLQFSESEERWTPDFCLEVARPSSTNSNKGWGSKHSKRISNTSTFAAHEKKKKSTKMPTLEHISQRGAEARIKWRIANLKGP